MAVTESLDAIRWDLADLVDGAGADGVDSLIDRALEQAASFAQRRRGKLAEMDGAALAEAMRELGDIYDLVGRADSYASLDFSTDTSDPVRGALVARVSERLTELSTTLLFFELEWAALDDERVEELLAHADLDFCRHHRPPLPLAPAERARRARDDREVGQRRERLDAPVRRADRRARGLDRRRGGRTRRRARAPDVTLARHASRVG